MATEEVNPYAAPVEDEDVSPEGDGSYRLASLGQRWAGAFIDRALLGGGALYLSSSLPDYATADRTELMMAVYLPIGVLSLFQGVLIGFTGQSIGKRVVGTKIVQARTAEPAGFFRGALLREWLPQVAMVIPAIPSLPAVLSIVDVLPIFGNHRRCLHDYLASTVVVRARRKPPRAS